MGNQLSIFKQEHAMKDCCKIYLPKKAMYGYTPSFIQLFDKGCLARGGQWQKSGTRMVYNSVLWIDLRQHLYTSVKLIA